MNNAPRKIETVVVFGGAGLVGLQICRYVCREYHPKKVVVAALFEHECLGAIEKVHQEYPEVLFVSEWGNIFVRSEYSKKDRKEMTTDQKIMNQLFEDVFGQVTQDKDNIGEQNLMGMIIHKHRPDIVVDCVNTATGISYQDVKSSSMIVKKFEDGLRDQLSQINKDDVNKAKKEDKAAITKVTDYCEKMLDLQTSPLDLYPYLNNVDMLGNLLVSQSIPQLVRHVTLLHKALVEVGTMAYVKVGTTGTGGMGINIPYTHGEDRPSFTLMAKSAVGFAHTGLLFLLARSPGPIIKEIKPGAMIGYRKVDFRPIKKFREEVLNWETKKQILSTDLKLKEPKDSYHANGPMNLVGIDTGENGFFSRGEYEAITYLSQMEFVTPEEIARIVIREINGASTGKDVIAAIDGAILDPSYRAGYIRQDALDAMKQLEHSKGIPSIAIGELGPPQLSKFLYEVHILESLYPTVDSLATNDSPEVMAQKVEKSLLGDVSLQNIITSLGLPILLNDGKTILRGPHINIPESKLSSQIKIQGPADIDKWAKQGWVDLRKENMLVWKERALKMMKSFEKVKNEGSASYSREVYNSKVLKTGEVVGWIFINEFNGGRVF